MPASIQQSNLAPSGNVFGRTLILGGPVFGGYVRPMLRRRDLSTTPKAASRSELLRPRRHSQIGLQSLPAAGIFLFGLLFRNRRWIEGWPARLNPTTLVENRISSGCQLVNRGQAGSGRMMVSHRAAERSPASKCTVPAAFLFAPQSRTIGVITMSSMCASVEIVWKFSAAKLRSPSSGSKRCDSRGFQPDGTILPYTRVPLASALLYRRCVSV